MEGETEGGMTLRLQGVSQKGLGWMTGSPQTKATHRRGPGLLGGPVTLLLMGLVTTQKQHMETQPWQNVLVDPKQATRPSDS